MKSFQCVTELPPDAVRKGLVRYKTLEIIGNKGRGKGGQGRYHHVDIASCSIRTLYASELRKECAGTLTRSDCGEVLHNYPCALKIIGAEAQ